MVGLVVCLLVGAARLTLGKEVAFDSKVVALDEEPVALDIKTIPLDKLVALGEKPVALDINAVDKPAALDNKPEQVHIAIGETSSDMVITWNTQAPAPTPTVSYGINETSETATGSTEVFVETGTKRRRLHREIYVHRVTLKNLLPDTKYVYKVGSTERWSNEFWFKTWPSGTDWSPRLYIYGDMGYENAVSLPKLVKDVAKHQVHAIIHVGDFAYNMDMDGGRLGDKFMRMIEPIAAYVPYMVCPGNHERMNNFTEYRGRFSMPGGTESLYYSFNMGPVHFISLDTEAYWYYEFIGYDVLVDQYEWLRNDLEEANRDRHLRPWIVVYGHRPMYCSSLSIECFHDAPTRVGVNHQYALEPLYKEFGVDLAFSGHQHNYERSHPVYNNEVSKDTAEPEDTIHIVTGSAGCKEYTRRFWPWMRPLTAVRHPDYGITDVHFLNSSHVTFKQIDVEQNKVVDDYTLVKHKHQPYYTRH